MTEECKKCGAPLPAAAPTGRPRSYCSVACRRLAEKEIARLSKILEGLEATRISAQFDSGPEIVDTSFRTRAQRLDDTSRAIADIEKRLGVLLAED